MTTTRSKRASILSIIGAAIIALIVITFWPTSLGGRAGYVITSGISMEPGIHQGDLVILRKTGDYAIGDAVAYQDPEIGQVFHRIIARDRHTYVLQGDNNSWTDNYQPAQEEILGERWIHLPGVGKWLDKARQPFVMGIFATVAGLLIAAPTRAIRRIRRAHRPPAQGQPNRPRLNGTSAGILSPDGQMVMSVVGVVSLTTVLLAALAFSRPIDRTSTIATEYQQHGSFDYSAKPRGTVYEDGVVQAGQPVYRALVDEIELSFNYALTSELPIKMSGLYRLDAVVTFDEGLTRTIPLVAESPFDGAATTISTTLDLSVVQQVIDQIARQIGTDGSQRVSIVPTVNVLGSVGGQTIDEVFAPTFDFQLDEVALRPDAKSSGSNDAGAIDPLRPVQSGTVEQSATGPATISFLILDIPVSTARLIAVIGVGASLLIWIVIVVLVLSALRATEPHRVRSRYGHLLIQVSDSDLGMIGRVVEVISIEDLVRVAEREGRMIIHQQHDAVHDYFVQDVDVTYRYWIRDGSVPASSAMTEVSRS